MARADTITAAGAAAALLLLVAPATASAGPIAYEPEHVSAADLPAFTDMPAEPMPRSMAPTEQADGSGGNQVPSPAGFGIFAAAAAGILGTRARRRRAR